MIKTLKEPCKSWKPNAGKANKSQQHSAHPQFIFCGLFFCFKLGFQSESGCDEATFPVWPLKAESGFVQPAFPLYPLSPLLPGDWLGNPEMLSLHCHQSSHNCIFTPLQNYQTRRIHSSALKYLWMLKNASCTMYICPLVKFNTFMPFQMQRPNTCDDAGQSNFRSWTHTRNLFAAVLCRLIAETK